MAHSSKYPDGYLPKIQYWNNELQKELNRGGFADRDRMVEIANKLSYFTQREFNQFYNKTSVN